MVTLLLSSPSDKLKTHWHRYVYMH